MANSDARPDTRMQHPSSGEEVGRFAERLGSILKGRSARSFAREAGVSETVFRKYLAGESEPTRPALIAIARTGNVSVGWLAAGEEGAGVGSQELSAEHLNVALELAEETLRGLWLPRRRYADLLALIYEGITRGLPYAEILAFTRPEAQKLAGGSADDGEQGVGGEGSPGARRR